jgi:catechol 2,3-dioxygenase-like lactoylglutathione lyase family enzyme
MTTVGVHHVAYRCNDAQETVDFYSGVLGLKYVMAMSEDRVPSTGELSPYMHIFFEVGPGSYLAFFELPKEAPMGRDPNTPDWVQHLALEVADMDTLLAMKDRLEGLDIDVVGPTDHTLFMSIYFFDPNGHRLELTTNIGEKALWDKTADMADSMLEEWNRTHGTVRQASFLHEKEMEEHESQG